MKTKIQNSIQNVRLYFENCSLDYKLYRGPFCLIVKQVSNQPRNRRSTQLPTDHKWFVMAASKYSNHLLTRFFSWKCPYTFPSTCISCWGPWKDYHLDFRRKNSCILAFPGSTLKCLQKNYTQQHGHNSLLLSGSRLCCCDCHSMTVSLYFSCWIL